MKKRTPVLTVGLALLMSAAASAQTVPLATLGNTGEAFSTAPGIETGAPVRLTVAPNVASPITLKVLPEATCVLHAEGSADAQHSLKLFADDDGIVRFEVRPSGESDEVAHFQVDCQADGKLGRFPFDLRASPSPTWDMPAPTNEVLQPKAGARVRPALTVDDAKGLSIEELSGRGYPPRPDPEQAPNAFATWLKAVTKPTTVIPARLVPNPGVRHPRQQVSAGNETSSNWSGYELRGAYHSYDLVEGEWYVPTVHGEGNGTPTYSAFWIGLDGDGTNDLVQDGTEQDTSWVCFFGICFDFATYYAWEEFLPQQPTEQVFGGFTVKPGDEIYSEVFMCTPQWILCIPSPSGNYAYFLIEDITQSESTVVSVARGNTFVGGYEAEWIMERPLIGGKLPDLANYGAAIMSDAYAQKPGGQWVVYYGASNENITMVNGPDVLSIVFPLPPGPTMEFLWTHFH